MRCPTLAELPPPPPGKTGWPWTEETPASAKLAASTLPRISVVTPSYMQAEYLEETIRSVLLQGYPNLEYFILDGGSKDGSADIIQRYQPWLAGWRSSRDDGQSATINEGWKQATGDIIAWINSDDTYHPNALLTAGETFSKSTEVRWLGGIVDDCHADGRFLKRHLPAGANLTESLGRRAPGYHQPGMFWRRAVLDQIGYLDSSLNYVFVHEFWVRSAMAGLQMTVLNQPIANFRLHSMSKTVSRHPLFLEEDWKVFRRHAPKLAPEEQKAAKAWLEDYEADRLLTTIYGMLSEGQRGKAIRHLAARACLLKLLRPRKLVLGLFWRVFVTGCPPEWAVRKSE